MKLSVDSDALVMPSSTGLARGRRACPALSTRSFSSWNTNLSTSSPTTKSVSPTSSIRTRRSIWRDDDLDVLVVDRHALQAVDLLHLVDQVALQPAVAEHRQDVVRVRASRPSGPRRPSHVVALVHADVLAVRDQVLLASPRCRPSRIDDLPHALR